MKEKELKNEGLADLAYKAEADHEVQMARAELYKIGKYAIKLHEMLKGVSEQDGLEGWVQSKITKAGDYLSSVYHHMDYEQKFEQVQTEAKAKPDFLDMDKDGDKKEPMKKAVKDKEEKKDKKESTDYKSGLAEELNKVLSKKKTERSLTKPEEKVKGSKTNALFNLGMAESAHKEIKKVKFDADLKLPNGKNIILQADDKDHTRGLVIRSNADGSYDSYYWYNDPKKKYPIEIKIDNKSVSKDAKNINWKYHPELKESVEERSLSKGEEKKKEKYVKGMKKAKGDFKDRYGDDAEAVMYATATKMAKKESVLEDYVNKPITEEEFEKLAEKKDACYHKVKSRYKVWPSAYASGALVQCRKKGAKNWGNKGK